MGEEHRIVRQVVAAQADIGAADDLVRQYLPFIKAETAKLIGRVPQEGRDDELGIAMLAFYEAAMAYRRGRGSFLGLAAAAIRNRLIDDHRREKRHGGVLSLDQPGPGDGAALVDTLADGRDEAEERAGRSAARAELAEFSKQLASFGLTLDEVARSCPRQERTLAACMKALAYARRNPELLRQLLQSRRLPVARLADGAAVERKTLERHRRYLVAAMLAYTNGFEIIRGHLRQIEREGGRTD